MNIPQFIKMYQKPVGFAVFLLLIIPLAAYLLSPSSGIGKKVLPASTKAKKMSEKESKSLVEKVGRLIELPQDELPTVATVANKFELPPQQFYQKAENADVVLIFFKAQKAILYRPSLNKIIEVSTIILPTPTLEKIDILRSTPVPSMSYPAAKSRILISPTN